MKTSLTILVLLLSASPAIQCQSSLSDAPQSSSQNSSATCTDPMTGLEVDCVEGGPQGLSQPQNSTEYRTQELRDSAPKDEYPASKATGSQDEKLNYQTSGAKLIRKPEPPEQPTEFQKFVAATTGQLLPVYGAAYFRDVPSTFSPNNLAPAAADYVIGPDDELRVRIWGQVNYSGNLRVDRSGSVYLPQVGPVQVAGLQFSALEQHLRAAVARVYRQFDLAVDVGKIRSIQIYVTGQAKHPGAYTVSSLSSLVDAFFASGGPTVQGSLRHILLNRNGKTIQDFDLYALLIRGDKSKDVHLLPEDVLYIAPVGPQVAMTGSVHNPAIYELRDNETLGNVIDMAGKTSAVASSARVSIDRVAEHRLRQAAEVGFDASGLAVQLADGDILQIFSILPAYEKTVTLRGNVANPGRFGWHEGMHLSELIPDLDSLVSRDYWWKRSHLGLPSPEFEPLVSSMGLDPAKGEFSRRGLTTSVTQETLTSALTHDRKKDNLQSNDATSQTPPPNGDQSTQNSTEENRDSRTGTANGSLASQMDTRSTEAMNVLGEPKRVEVKISSSEIDWKYAVIERINPETLKTSLLPFDLGDLVLKHDGTQDLVLQQGDTVTVFSQADIRVPIDQQTKYVDLEGEFVHSGIYSVMPGETLRDLVQRAGGLSGKAYLYGSEFDRESTRILQQQRIDEYVSRVDLEAERGTLALTSSATSSAGSLASASSSQAAERDLIARLKLIRATGRIVLQIPVDSSSLDILPDIGLENGDRFFVPAVPATVNVVGAVYDQNSFRYQHGERAGHYLMIAGGPDRDADRRNAFVIRADGSVVGHSSQQGLWGNKFKDLRLSPGDTIVVPDKTLRPTALRGLLDWTQIFSQLAIGAAAVNVLR